MGNDLRLLDRELAENITSCRNGLDGQLVLLPEIGLKDELLLRLSGEAEVVMGVRFMEVRAGLYHLAHALTGHRLFTPPADLLGLHLLPFVRREFPTLPERGAHDYADKVAKEFLDYGRFAEEKELRLWIAGSGMRQRLWQRTFSDSGWDAPLFGLRGPLSPFEARGERRVTLHLYGISSMPLLYYEFFEKVASFCPVYYYCFSPCRVFWTDLVSERTRINMEKGVAPTGREELSRYLQDRPLPLAYWGRLACRTLRFFEEGRYEMEERYVDPPAPTSLLRRVQKELLDFAYIEEGEKEADSSILLHPAPSPIREVEIVYETLVALSCKPSDIRVYAPDISLYAPLISLIFGAEDSVFSFRIADLPGERTSPFLRAVSALFALYENRFSEDAVSDLFFSPSFREKHGLKESEVEVFLAKSRACGARTGRWRGAINSLLDSVIRIPKHPVRHRSLLLEFSEIESFGLCASLLYSLDEALTALHETEETLSRWSTLICSFIDTYLTTVDPEERASRERLEKRLRLLESDRLPDEIYPFSAVLRYVESGFSETVYSRVEGEKSIRFGSLRSGSVTSASVICLLGLNESAFPGISSPPLYGPDCSVKATAQLIDRHLFLEVLTGARDTLVISYLSVDPTDGKAGTPSVVVRELQSYLAPADIEVRHPPFPFHRSYFEEKRGPMAESMQRAAVTFYAEEKGKLASLIPDRDPTAPSLDPSGDDSEIDLADLSSFAANPIRFYMKRHLHVRFPYEEGDGELFLSPLNRQLWERRLHADPLAAVLREERWSSLLPSGLFGEAALFDLARTEKTIGDSLRRMGLSFDAPTFRFVRVGPVSGTLFDLCEEGLLVYGEATLCDLVKVWPLWLVFAESDLPYEKDLLLTKGGLRLSLRGHDTEKALARYLEYYGVASRFPSPLLPVLADVFKKGGKGLEGKITKCTCPYARRLFPSEGPHIRDLAESWLGLLQPLLEDIERVLP
ncbi:MAG: exodeoxyribonuclease V subunit gamma [Simkaniaceae bacterium]|nr:exodeoxyribonuclease V subunit gamma [Simkaniaceae bacterium]